MGYFSGPAGVLILSEHNGNFLMEKQDQAALNC
jgi:hypothetical protein